MNNEIPALLASCRFVEGQARAKVQLATLLRRQHQTAAGYWPSSVSALICGPTGVGKTYITRTMCAASGLPFAEVNATQYSETGFAGRDLSTALIGLLQSAADLIDEEHDDVRGHVVREEAELFDRKDLSAVIERAQGGVLMFDEFDKWMMTGSTPEGRDKGRGLQAELLKFIEGSQVAVTDIEDNFGDLVDTSRIMFLCAGAFTGLGTIVRRRMEREEIDMETIWDVLEPQDFVRFGLLPELAGRLAVHVVLGVLRTESYVRILSSEGGLVDEYRRRFALEGAELVLEEGALIKIADVARSKQTGARALRHVMEQALAPALHAAAMTGAHTRVTVTAANVEPPQIQPVLV